MAQSQAVAPTRRDFLYIATGTFGAFGAALSLWPFIDQMNPSAAVLALASVEVDISSVRPGQSITVMWRSKPVFIRRRTPKEIQEAEAVPVSELLDPLARNANLPEDAPATDENRLTPNVNMPSTAAGAQPGAGPAAAPVPAQGGTASAASNSSPPAEPTAGSAKQPTAAPAPATEASGANPPAQPNAASQTAAPPTQQAGPAAAPANAPQPSSAAAPSAEPSAAPAAAAASKPAEKKEWLIVVGVCTHLGCIPLGYQGNWGGWLCPCHGSQYDTAGRVRRGPAPENLAVPPYAFLSDTRIKIG